MTYSIQKIVLDDGLTGKNVELLTFNMTKRENIIIGGRKDH